MFEEIKQFIKEDLKSFIIRHLLAIIGFTGLSAALWAYYKEQYWNIIFALFVAIYTECIALLVCSFAIYYYTKQKPSEMTDGLKGRIFVGVHVLFAVIIGLIFWSKIGA